MNYVKRYYNGYFKAFYQYPNACYGLTYEPLKQYASCVLLILTILFLVSSAAIWLLEDTSFKEIRIGINSGRVRGINSRIRGGRPTHWCYIIPFLKKFEATVKCCTQNGVRGVNCYCSHLFVIKVEDIIVLKNNKGTEDNRVRKLDYSIQMSKLFYQRFIKNEDITLFSPHEVPELMDA